MKFSAGSVTWIHACPSSAELVRVFGTPRRRLLAKGIVAANQYQCGGLWISQGAWLQERLPGQVPAGADQRRNAVRDAGPRRGERDPRIWSGRPEKLWQAEEGNGESQSSQAAGEYHDGRAGPGEKSSRPIFV